MKNIYCKKKKIYIFLKYEEKKYKESANTTCGTSNNAFHLLINYVQNLVYSAINTFL